MRAKLSLKTLYRSPVRMILTFILLVAVTFTLFSQVLEHAVTVREIDKAAEQYDGVGAVEVSPPDTMDGKFPHSFTSCYIWNDDCIDIGQQYIELEDGTKLPRRGFPPNQYEPLSKENIADIGKLDYVSYMDARYMTGGVCKELLRLDEGSHFYCFNADCIIEGTLEEPLGTGNDYYGNKKLRLDDAVLVCGNQEYHFGDLMEVLVIAPGELRYGMESNGTERGTAVTIKGSQYNSKFVDSLEYGRRYAFVVRNDPIIGPNRFYLSDYLFETWTDTFWDVTDAPENYLELEEYAEIKRVADMINLNDHTFDIVYTDDTEGIWRFSQGDMVIAEGRGITPEDSVTNPNVCVISHKFATEYGLSVGDTVTMKLGDKLFEQYKGIGAIPIVPGRVSDSYTEVTLEIVGIYLDIDPNYKQAENPHWAYSINTFFVPKALLNVSEEELANHNFYPGEVSFKIENAWDIAAFMEEGIPQLEKMGLTVFFEDNGWLAMEAGFKATEQLGIIKICVLSAAVLVAIWFVAMLYITGRKKDYAVMRVLGTSVRKSNRAMLLPFMVLAVISAICSAILAWLNTKRTIANNNTLVSLSEFGVDTSIPTWTVAVCFIAAVVVGFIVAMLILMRLGKKSPLELLQSDSTKRKKDKKVKIEISAPAEEVYIEAKEISVQTDLVKHKKYSRRFVWKYVFRHIKRTAAKALLTVLICVLLLNVIGQLDIMIDSYEVLVRETKITSNYAGGLPFAKVQELEDSGYAEDIYYLSKCLMEVDFVSNDIYVTNDISRTTGYELQIEFADGYDASRLERKGNVILMSRSYAEQNGIELGEDVWVGIPYFAKATKDYLLEIHRGKYPDDNRTADDMPELYPEEFAQWYSGMADSFTVIGLFTVEDENYMFEYESAMFTPGINEVNEYYGLSAPMEIVEATVSDNTLIDEYREFGQKLAGGSLTEGVMFIMDTSKLENLRNTLRLVEMLYPIAVVVTLVIGAFLCGLIIVQTSKDIAIMRVLGTSKAKTRTILVLEQTILCVIGIIISGIVLYIRGALAQMLWVFGAYALVILLASIVASAAASRKNVLELLQTKE